MLRFCLLYIDAGRLLGWGLESGAGLHETHPSHARRPSNIVIDAILCSVSVEQREGIPERISAGSTWTHCPVTKISAVEDQALLLHVDVARALSWQCGELGRVGRGIARKPSSW